MVPDDMVDLADLEPLHVVMEKRVEWGYQDGNAGIRETGSEHERQTLPAASGQHHY